MTSQNTEEFEIRMWSNSSSTSDQPLPDLFYMTENSKRVVIVYIILFFIATTGNLSVFISVCRHIRRLKWRITILIAHLALADLFVAFFTILQEILWRFSVQWYGGNILCKVCQFLRAFGLYLSSMILICISVDRFFAIIFPLKMVRATGRVKASIILAWLSATICALPQIFVFSVKSHPEFPEFQQCISYGYFSSWKEEAVYNIFSLMALYFVPLLVIVVTYSMILYKICQKSKEHLKEAPDVLQEGCPMPGCSGKRVRYNQDSHRVIMLTRAKFRTLKLTVVIILVFVACYTPYAFITLWYMFDREGAQSIDPQVQDALFIMAVMNSCVNPMVYGSYAPKSKGLCSRLKCGLGSPRRNSTENENLPVTSVI